MSDRWTHIWVQLQKKQSSRSLLVSAKDAGTHHAKQLSEGTICCANILVYANEATCTYTLTCHGPATNKHKKKKEKKKIDQFAALFTGKSMDHGICFLQSNMTCFITLQSDVFTFLLFL